MSFERNKTNYTYVFSNKVSHVMTPIDAHKYAHKHKVDILRGPGYAKEEKAKAFSGYGFHDGLLMSFRGPRHYREYLKEHGLHEASINDRPMENKYEPPMWNEELIRKCIHEHKIEIGSVLAEALLSGELDWPEEGW